MKKRILAAVIAAVFAVLNVASALPVFALNESTTRYPTPEGYNDHDYQKLVAFLEQTDDEGVKNGEKLSDNYDPNDPATWGSSYRFEWIESDGELRIQRVDVYLRDLCGTLDMSGCTALSWLYCSENNLTSLDVSGCTALEDLNCGYNNLTSLDVSECTDLLFAECGFNFITELDISGCTALQELDCYFNSLTELDVSSNTALEYLDCSYNKLTELDLINTELPINRIRAEGKGYIGYSYRIYAYEFPEVGDDLISYGCDDICAEPKHGESFLGWYNEDGELLSTDAKWDITDRTETVFIAKFTGGEPEIIPGDADGDGELTFNDVTVLYYYLLNGDMTGMTPESLASADLNNDGVISVSDITLMFNLLLGGS